MSVLTKSVSRRRPIQRKRRLFLEQLEDRRLLALVTWDGSVNNLWSEPGNWDTGVPVNGDGVVIPATANPEVLFDSSAAAVTLVSLTSVEPFRITGSTLTLDGAGTFSMTAGLGLEGGTLAGTGTLTVSGTLAWSNGAMSGTGQTNANGGMTISGTNVKFINARTLNIAVGTTATWTDTGNIAGGGGSTINVSGTFNVQTDADIVNQFSGVAALTINAGGALRKSVATGLTTISNPWVLNNNGTAEAQTGTISADNGGTSGGSFIAQPAGTFNFGGGTHTLTGTSSVSGAGTIGFSGGTTDIAGTYTVAGRTLVNGGAAVANFNSAATTGTLELSSGTQAGSNTLTVSGLTTWTGGTFAGSGQTNANGGMDINGVNSKFINARTLNIAAATTATWTGTGTIAGGGGSTINVSGTFDIQTDADIVNQFSGVAALTINAGGTLRKSVATGVTTISNPWVLNNNGTVEVQTGTISADNGGTSGGSFIAQATGTFNFGGGPHTLTGASSVSGAGTIGFSGGTTDIGGAYTVAGRTLVNGGTANFNSAASTGTLELSSGTQAGSNALAVNGLTTWTGGTFAGNGQTNANGGMDINSANSKFINARTLNIAAATTATWTGTGTIAGGNGSTINVSGTFDIQTDADIVNQFSGAATFTVNPTGTLRKSVGTGVTSISNPWVLNNNGAVEVQTGTISADNGGTSSGSFTAQATGTFNFGGATHTLTGTSSVSGAGTIGFSSGTADIGGTYTVAGRTLVNGGTANFNSAASTGTIELSSGTQAGSNTLTVSGLTTWTGGTFAGNGQTNANGGMDINSANSKFINARTLNIAAGTTATWTGTGTIAGGNGSTINNSGLFDIQTDADIVNQFSGVAALNNSGTFRKSSGAASTDVNSPWAFNNTGMVEAQSGNLGFFSYLQTAGSLELAGGSVSSSQTMQIQGGTVEGNGTITASVTNSGGTLTPGTSPGTPLGSITIDGDYVQTDGAPPSGEFAVEIGGTTAVTQYDQVVVTGLNHEATLAGTLTVTLVNGFVPAIGNSFTILQGPASGSFDTLNLPPLPPDRQWQVNINSVVLTVEAVGAVPCDVTNTLDSGAGSLRAAIDCSNASVGVIDTITFNIPNAGPHTISPMSALPTITDPVIIDGYTQPGAGVNTDPGGFNGTLQIVLNGASAGNASGLVISAGDSTVRGLVINQFGVNTSSELGAQGIVLTDNGGNRIEGNFIGTDATGTMDQGNFLNGINIVSGSNNIIGGTTPQARNVISGNGVEGVTIRLTVAGLGSVADGNIIQGNFIGTQANGIGPLGNGRGGIIINVVSGNQAIGNAVGGTAIGAGNRIAFNGSSGVEIASAGTATGNVFLGNSIFSNSDFGIDLAGNGVTPNDAGDADTGPNNLQNFPVLTSVTQDATTTTFQGTLNSLPNTSFRIEFFASAGGDPSGFGEGQNFVGFTTVLTNAGGDATFTFNELTQPGTVFTATATRLDAGLLPIETSEFSAVPTVSLVMTTTDLTSSPDPSVFGQTVTFTATVTSNPPSMLTPVGSVTFVDTTTATTLGTITLDAQGMATLSTSLLTAGLHTIQANYTDSTGTFANSSGTDNQQVSQAATTTSLTSSPDPSVFGQNVTFTVTVSSIAPSTLTPVGSVTFVDTTTATTLGTRTLDAQGMATLSTSVLTAGLHSVQASYTDSTGNFASSSDTDDQQVTQAATTTTLESSLNPSSFGQSVTFTATVSATAPSTATPVGSVTFVDTTTATTLGTVTVDAQGMAALSTSTLAAGDHNIQATFSNAAGNFAGSSDSLVQTVQPATPMANLAVDKTGPATVPAGQNITYTITLTNNGPADAQNVVLTDAIPTGTSSVSFSQTSGPAFTLAFSGTAFTASATTFTAAAAATFTMVVTAATSNPDGTIVTNTASVTTDTTDPNTGNNSDSVNTTVLNTANLAVDKTGPVTVPAGQNITYAITLTNSGPVDAQNVVLTDAIPTGTTSVSFAQTSGPAFALAFTGTAFTASAATFTASAAATFVMVVTANPANPNGTIITNTAAATTTTSDPNTANNSDAVNTTVLNAADLVVTKSGQANVLPGENITYTLTVTNNGPIPAQNVVLTDTVPANTTFAGFLGISQGSATQIGDQITANFGTITVGTPATLTFVVTTDAASPNGTIVTNTATATSDTFDPNTANNTGVETTRVGTPGLPDCEVITLNSPGAPGTATMEDDADNPGENVLIVTGTSGNDVIVIEPQPRSRGLFRVIRNNRVIVTFISQDVQRIVVFALAGNDKVIVNGSMTQSAILFGDAGNDFLYGARGADGLEGGSGVDRLFGGSNDDTLCGGDGNDFVYGQAGNDFAGGDAGNDKVFGEAGNDFLLGNDGNDNLYGGIGNDRMFGQAGNDQIFGEPGNDIGVGGDGNDKLFGGSGRDVLIGGDGLDLLFGGGHDDILVAGPTSHDEDDEALQAILAEWTSNNSYANRVNSIRNGGGANGPFVLDDTTVSDDGLKDTLWGDGGLDWFLFGDGDKLKDKARSELVN